MVEAIQCPSCQTRYGLRQARVRSGVRRAQCFRCGDVFQIEPEVKRLLAALEPAAISSVPLAALAEVREHHDASTPALESHDLTLGDLEIPEPELEETPAVAALPSPTETAPIPSMARTPALPMAEMEPAAAPSMADFELPPIPEPAAAPEAAPEEAAAFGGSYASARDAIARLFGDTPLAPSPTANLRNALDMDAGMKALEDTLGGVKPEALSTKPFAAPAHEPNAVPMAEAELPHASATLRLTAAEVASATGSTISSGSTLSKAPEPPEITQEEVTVVLPPPPAPVSASTAASTLDAADPSALRLRIGDQTYAGLDLPTIAKWIEEGRVLEDHQVARGMSENWMDAFKVPALRPVFERLRRARAGITDILPPPPTGIADTGSKRGLFGGMFGK